MASAAAGAAGRTARPASPGPLSPSSRTPFSPVLLPPGYDKAKDNPLKIHSIGSNAAHRVNLSFVTLAVISREGGSPGTARAAYKLETGRRVRRIPIAKMDANPYRIPQTGMVAVGPKDY